MHALLDGLPYVAAVALWTVSLARWKMARDRATRFAWTAMVALAAAQFFQIEPLYRIFEHTTTIIGSGAVAKHALTLISAASVAVASTEALIPHDGRPSRLRQRLPWIGLGGALMVSIAPWVFDPPQHLAAALADRAEYFDPTWRSAAHWAAYLGYLAWALTMASRACWRFRAAADESTSRRAFTLVGAGTAVSLAYIIEKAIVVLVWLQGSGSHTVMLDQVAETGICLVGLPLIALGCSYEPLAIRVAEIQRQRDSRQVLHGVTPFAERAYQAFPYMRTSFVSIDPDERIIAAVAAIHEALRQLTCYQPAPDLNHTTDAQRQDRRAEWLNCALAAKDCGLVPTFGVSAAPIDDTGQSMDSARALAALYRHALRHAAGEAYEPDLTTAPSKDPRDAQLPSAA